MKSPILGVSDLSQLQDSARNLNKTWSGVAYLD